MLVFAVIMRYRLPVVIFAFVFSYRPLNGVECSCTGDGIRASKLFTQCRYLHVVGVSSGDCYARFEADALYFGVKWSAMCTCSTVVGSS